MKLLKEFYIRPDVTQVARELLGKVLFTDFEEGKTAAIISEVEAYSGRNDKACHANNYRRTTRTEIMYHEGGKAYVYLCYGIHHLFNVVTNTDGLADAVLIRAAIPYIGEEIMIKRRGLNNRKGKVAAGPGTMSQALGIKTQHYGQNLLGDRIWIEDRGIKIKEKQIQTSARIGVAYAEEDAHKPWRYYIEDKIIDGISGKIS